MIARLKGDFEPKMVADWSHICAAIEASNCHVKAMLPLMAANYLAVGHPADNNDLVARRAFDFALAMFDIDAMTVGEPRDAS